MKPLLAIQHFPKKPALTAVISLLPIPTGINKARIDIADHWPVALKNTLQVKSKKWQYAPALVSLLTLFMAAGCGSEPNYTFETPWTVEVVDQEVTYTLQAPFGTFLIHRDSEIDYDNHRVSGLTSTTLRWHYESGEPWWLWLSKHDKPLNDTSEVKLAADISTISADLDAAEISKRVRFEQHLKSKQPGVVPVLQGKIWNDTVSKYRGPSTTYYVIEKREPFDGSVIVCRDSATYCGLYGARVRDTLTIEDILILEEDVKNWKQYQQKVQMLVEQAIIDVRPTERSKTNRWLFWRK